MKNKNTLAIIGVIAGIAAIICGIVMLSLSVGGQYNYTPGITFGGDFYTHIYSATQNAANNVGGVYFAVEDLFNIIKLGFGLIFIIGGIVIACSFGMKIDSTSENIENNEEEYNEDEKFYKESVYENAGESDELAEEAQESEEV